jgi:hypothetical protein
MLKIERTGDPFYLALDMALKGLFFIARNGEKLSRRSRKNCDNKLKAERSKHNEKRRSKKNHSRDHRRTTE